ncbi:MAG: hypothetical protein PWP51_2211 [Clostridiales bacterium]|jgi:H+/gluconate symporter-like permease|nr:hypothetical protein [Clostridiales bacterium]
MTVLSGIGILIGFAVLMFGAWKKVNLLVVTLVVSAIIAVFSGMNVAEVWTGPYIDGFMGFAGKYLLLFCFGALFGKVLEDSGAGWRIANTIASKAGDKWSLATFVAVTLILLYGGVSIFVIVFFILPIGKSLFKKLRIPWSYFPGIAMLGTIPPVGMLPGSLQLLNIIPTSYFGTTLMAAPVIGLIVTVLYFILGYLYIKWIMKNSETNFDLQEFSLTQSIELDEAALNESAPSFWLSILPIALALIIINVLKVDIVFGLIISSAVGIVLFKKSMGNVLDTINAGVANGILPVIYVSVVVGVARTVAAAPFFEVMKNFLLTLSIPGLFKVVATTSILSAMTGSSSGSMTMILELFGNDFLSWGYNPELLHRLISTASLGFDSLPWNSVVVVFFTLSGVSYAKGYKHVFATTVLMPLICTLAIILMGSVFY